MIIDHGRPRRIGAVILRHWYLIAGSWPRFLDLTYWPMVQMILWGFIQTFLSLSLIHISEPTRPY